MIEFLTIVSVYLLVGFIFSTLIALNSKKDSWYSGPAPTEFMGMAMFWPLALALGLIQMWLNFIAKDW